jgi:hypothetical protein
MTAIAGRAAGADTTSQYDYAYGPNHITSSAAGFILARTIDGSLLPNPPESVDDVSVGGGKLYIADSVSSGVYVLNAEDYSYIATITTLIDTIHEEQVTLTNPEGLYLSGPLNELYIADTNAERIVVLDAEDHSLKRIITRPENMAGVTNFKPSKIAADLSGRIYFVVSGSFEGIVQLNPAGDFSRYFGVNKPEVKLADYFWKSIASPDQKSKMAKTYAPSFSNIDIDSEGFVYAVTRDAVSEKMIFRFNAKGENVIREEGYIPLRGDMTRMYENNNVASAFTGIAAAGFGVYAVLDRSYGRVFVYDFDGYMLTVFSKLGDMKGDLREPSAIAWNGYDLLVGDKALGLVYVYTPTEFGRAALSAAERYNKGDWDAAAACFERALSLNANFYAGYSGLGRSFLMRRNYREAMYYFKMAADTKMYSQAYNGYRGIWIRKYFLVFMVIVLLFCGAVVYSELRYVRKNKD